MKFFSDKKSKGNLKKNNTKKENSNIKNKDKPKKRINFKDIFPINLIDKNDRLLKDKNKVTRENKLMEEIINREDMKDIGNRISINREASNELLKDLGLFEESKNNVERDIEETLMNRDIKKKIKEIDKINRKSINKKLFFKKKYTPKDLMILSKETELIKKKRASDYVIIRKEIENRAPIQSVNNWNKLLLTFKEMDRRGGWSEKRKILEEKKKKEQSMAIQSKIFKKMKEVVEERIKNRDIEFGIEIKLNKKYREELNEVLKMDYFSIFSEIKEVKHNPNYYMYKAYPPIVLIFKRNSELEYL